MILTNNNISVLPFYDNLLQQNHRKDYAYGKIYDLITHGNNILPFNIMIDKSYSSIYKVLLINFNSKKSIDITSSMLNAGLRMVTTYELFNVLKFISNFPIQELKYEGRYYLSIQFNSVSGGIIFSDVFTTCHDVSCFLKLEFSNSYNINISTTGIIDFDNNFKYICYLNTQIGKPEYIFEEEGTNRGGYFFMESQVSKKIYKFTFLAPEYLCDILRIVRVCNNKSITSKNNTYINFDTFNMNVKWEEQGDLASVEAEFETDTVVANLGGYKCIVEGKVRDFNSDFNNDYK